MSFYGEGGLLVQKLLPILNKTALSKKNHKLFGSQPGPKDHSGCFQ